MGKKLMPSICSKAYIPRVVKTSGLLGNRLTLSQMTNFNFLPHNKFLDCSKLKASADDKLNVREKLKFTLGRVGNIVEKEKMLVTSIFSFSYMVFKRLFCLRSLKVIEW